MTPTPRPPGRRALLKRLSSDTVYRVMLAAITVVSFASMVLIGLGLTDAVGYISRSLFALLCFGLLLRHVAHHDLHDDDADDGGE